MSTYYSAPHPHGNAEVWDVKPDGYLTVAEYMETVPPPPSPPALTEEEINTRRRAEIQTLLDEIDRKSARPLRAVAAGTATDDDRTALADLEQRAVGLRAELSEIGG